MDSVASSKLCIIDEEFYAKTTFYISVKRKEVLTGTWKRYFRSVIVSLFKSDQKMKLSKFVGSRGFQKYQSREEMSQLFTFIT